MATVDLLRACAKSIARQIKAEFQNINNSWLNPGMK
jgi:hypothetical protein